MRKSILLLLAAVFIVSILVPGQTVYAQLSFDAEMNKSFLPINIAPGGISRLSVTIFNPNSFALTNASWLDNLPAGVTVANPVNLSNSCFGTVTAVPGGTTLSLSGGTVPAQGATPGSCTVAIDVTSSTPGNHFFNTIPAGSLSTDENVTTTDPASATLRVGVVQPPTVSKSFNPSTIWAGRTSRLTITIRNNDSATTLTQASLTDNLPTNVFLANPVNAVLSGCGVGASVDAVSGGGTVTLNNGTIAPSSTCTIQVNVTSNVQGAYTNTIPAGGLDTAENLTNASPATARLNVDLIGIAKSFSPATVPAGGTTTLTIVLRNPTGSPYTGVAFTDNLPAPLTVVSVTGNTCGGTVSTTLTSVTLAGGIIPAGSITTPGTCTISVQVAVPAGTPSGTLTNRIPPGGLTTDQGVGNPRPAVADIRVAGSEVIGSKSFSPTTITAGGNSRLRIVIRAPGDTNLDNFSITDTLPVGVTVSNSSPPTATGCGAAPPRVFNPQPGDTSISLTFGLILQSATCTIDVWVTSSVTGMHTNTIPPGNITNDQNRTTAASFSANLTVTGAGNLAIEIVKSFNPLLVAGGAPSTMSILLINPESVTLTGIAFTDNMPTEMILSNPVNFDEGSCNGTLTGTPGSNSFSFSGGGPLAAGETCTLTLSATITVTGNRTNTIPVGAVTTNEGATNPNPTDATLTNLPGASVSKAFAPNPMAAGSFSVLTITILNTGNIDLTGMGLDDNLPAGLVVAGPPAPAFNNGCGGTFSAVAGTSIVQLTNGALASNSSCTIEVSVTGSTPGDYENTIPEGSLITDPAITNTSPATATLRINPSSPGGGGGGGGATSNPSATNAFLIPVTGFEQGVVTELSPAPSSSYYSATSISLDIPSLSVNIPIVGVPKIDGTWNVSWLGKQAGWLEGSAFPSWNGNSVLTSHVYLSNGKPGPFAKLHELKFGDQIIVHAYGQKYIFEVRANAIVAPNDKSVMKHEERPWLTLVTCTDYDEKTGTYKNRFIVRAILMKVSVDR